MTIFCKAYAFSFPLLDPLLIHFVNIIFLISRIETVPFEREGDYCIRFSYNMYGWHIGQLDVSVASRTRGIQVTGSIEGEQTKRSVWRTMQIDAYIYRDDVVMPLQNKIFINLTGSYAL